MKFGFLTDQDSTRFCYLRLRRLKLALKDPKITAGLVNELQLAGEISPGESSRKAMAVVERRIDELRATKGSIWYGVAAAEVLAASIFKAKRLADGTAQDLFTHASRDRYLTQAVLTWLEGGGLTPSQHISVGNVRADAAGYRKGMLSGARVVAVQIRNDLGELKRALEEMENLAPYTNAMYLACTPALAAAYLVDFVDSPRARTWDAKALERKLRAVGAGLLLVEGDALSQALPAKERQLDGKKLAELVAAIARR